MSKCVGFFLWRVDELLYMIHLSSLFSMDVDYLSLFFFLTCLVGMWHTFFGYASFFSFFYLFFLTCLLSMWHTYFGYASFIYFCIVHILYGHFREKESWYVMEFYFVSGWKCLLFVSGCVRDLDHENMTSL